VEGYVLGLTTPAERTEFEALCLKYPELVQAREAFEITLETALMKDALNPPTAAKEKILKALAPSKFNGITSNGETAAKLSPVVPVAPVKRINAWKWIAVASLILLIGSLYWAYSVTVEYQRSLQGRVASEKEVNPYEDPYRYENFKRIVEKPSIKWSILVEPNNADHCMAHVYWDSLSKGTYLLVGNIPSAKSDKQFQLWAVGKDQAVNLGVFDIKKEGQLVRMKSIPTAKTFIITIEPKGGSPTPSMSSMYAIGKL
jgi:hypothetical protein